MTKFLVNIRAYGYHARFIVEAEDNAESIENSIVDKLGEKGVRWEKDGFTSRSIKWITYEEVLDANTFRPLQAEKEAGTGLGTASS
tara:strand:+ start:303 stop:560 length:258 start_codon:yes stop_codon:yes gene_type:complete